MTFWLRLIAIALCAALGASVSAAAVQRALLVGVSELVNQPAAHWLQAPRNDVNLMREALLQRGFADQDITVLADGVRGAALPEAQAIHSALAHLLEVSRSGDFVVLYFSGHGVRHRDHSKQYQEPDGLAEHFLARDAQGAGQGGSAPAGGLRDVELAAWVNAFLARNVFVWSVFDTCAATSMTRSAATPRAADIGPPDDEVRFRGLRSAELATSANAPAPLAAAVPESERVPRARYVAFFASESHQVTPELRLPRHDAAARPLGLLTWAITESLRARPATWRELYEDVLALYPPVIAELETRFPLRELPSPVAEGNLDQPLFRNSMAAVSTRPVWRAQRSRDRLQLAVGALDGLEAQQPVRVLARLADGTAQSANARLSQLEAGRAQLALPSALAALSDDVQWRVTPAGEPAAAVLRVAAAQPLPEGLSLAYPAAIRRVSLGDAQADVLWTPAPGAGHRLAWPAAVGPLGGPAAGVVALPNAQALRERLHALAQRKWLTQLQTLARDDALAGFEANVEVWRGERLLRSAPLRGAQAPAPPVPGERVRLQLRNQSGQSLDLIVVGFDGDGRAWPVYPQDAGQTNRFERGSPEEPASTRFELPWLAGTAARLYVVAAPALPHSPPRLFGSSATTPWAGLRLRGPAPSDPPRQLFAASFSF